VVSPARATEGEGLERVRREVRIGREFSRDEFEAAFAAFRQTYNVAPLRALCAPDVLSRFCALFERSGDVVHQHSLQLRYRGVPLVASLVAPGTVAFEGEVDEERMGDW
jgi:hypothetical protein